MTDNEFSRRFPALEINTQETCIFCIKLFPSGADVGRGDGDGSSLLKMTSLRNLPSYLGIDLLHISNLCSGENCGKKHNVELKAWFCEECSGTLDQFHEAFRESTESSLNVALRMIADRIKEGSEIVERVMEFNKRMMTKGNFFESLCVQKFARDFRAEMRKQCLTKLKASAPAREAEIVPKISVNGDGSLGIEVVDGSVPRLPDGASDDEMVDEDKCNAVKNTADAPGVSLDSNEPVEPLLENLTQYSQSVLDFSKNSESSTGTGISPRPGTPERESSPILRSGKEKVDGKLYKCPLCKKCLKYKANLKRHIAVTHSDSRPFKCGVCSKTYKIKSNLLRHALVHSSNKAFQCELCDKAFKDQGSLTRHITSVHGRSYSRKKRRIYF